MPPPVAYPSTLSDSRAPRHGGLTTNLNEILQDRGSVVQNVDKMRANE